MNYAETLPLADKEVVLTFDDGPLPPYTNRILEILAAECVNATYFIVGSMARAYPDWCGAPTGRGHTIGTHSHDPSVPVRHAGLERTKAQIDDGIAATEAALGDPARGGALLPLSRARRAPSGRRLSRLARPDGLERRFPGRRLAAHQRRRDRAARPAPDRGAWDAASCCCTTSTRRPCWRCRRILEELKARGYHIVHVVPATAELAKTIDHGRRLARARAASATAADVGPRRCSGHERPVRGRQERRRPMRVATARRAPRLAKHHSRHRHAFAEGHNRRHHHRLSERSRESRASLEKQRDGGITKTKVAGIGGLLGLFNQTAQETKAGGARSALHARARHASSARREHGREKVAAPRSPCPTSSAIVRA